MSDLARQLVYAIAAGNAAEAQAAFEAAAAERMLPALEDKRKEVARTMFLDITDEAGPDDEVETDAQDNQENDDV